MGTMQKGPSEIAVVQISLTEYITKRYRNMVGQIPQKCILWPWNQWAAPWWSPGAARQHTRELMSTTYTHPWLIP